MTTQQRASRLLGAAAVCAASSTLLGACGGSTSAASAAPAGPATFAISGKIEPYAGTFPTRRETTFGADGKPDIDWPQMGDVCTAKNGLVAAGDSVVVADATGKTVGLTTLSAGVYSSDSTASFCRFTFTASAPDNSDFYAVKIGQEPPVTFSRADAAAPAFSIGGTPHGTL